MRRLARRRRVRLLGPEVADLGVRAVVCPPPEVLMSTPLPRCLTRCVPLAALALAALAGPASAAPILDLDLASEGALVTGADAHLEVHTHLATGLLERRPAAGAEVSVTLAIPTDAAPRELWRGHTDAMGVASIHFVTPALPVDRATLTVTAQSGGLSARVTRTVTLRDSAILSVRADRTLYRPGSTVRWRVAHLRAANAHAIAAEDAHVSILDPRGTRLWSGRVRTDARGLASGELPLADDLLTGRYTLRAQAGRAHAQLDFEVRPFDLPPFFVDLTLDADPLTRRAAGTVRAHSAYGEPVLGHLRLTAEIDGASPQLLADRDLDGTDLPFVVPLPAAGTGAVRVTAAVTDGADRTARATRAVSLSGDALDAALVLSGDALAPGVPQLVHVVTTDAAGQPTPARVRLRLLAGERVLATTHATSAGAAALTLDVPASIPTRREVFRAHLDHWSLEASDDLFADGDPQIAIGGALEALTSRLARCVGADTLALRAVLEARTWRLASVQQRPFPERPDFTLDAPAPTASCLADILLRALPVRTRIPRHARAILEFQLTGERLEADAAEAIHTVRLEVDARTDDGRTAATSRDVRVASPRHALHPLSVLSPVVAAGEPLRVRAVWERDSDEPILATVLRHGAPVATALARRHGDEVVAELPIPAGVYGLVTVHLHQGVWSPDAPALVHRFGAANAFIAPSALAVALVTPQRVTPGSPVSVEVAVRDAAGRPVPEAGLTAAVVDERLLALAKPQRPLSVVLLESDLDALGERGRLFAALLARSERTDAELGVMAALLASVPVDSRPPELLRPAAERLRAERGQLGAVRAAATSELVRRGGAVVGAVDGGAVRDLLAPLAELLAAAGWPPERVADVFGAPRTWAGVRVIQPTWTPDAWGEWVTRSRLDELAERLVRQRVTVRARLRRQGAHDPAPHAGRPHLAVDAWGHAFLVSADPGTSAVAVSSAGADGRHGTADDLARRDIFAELRGYGGAMGYGSGAAGFGAGGGGQGASIRVGHAVATAEAAAPLRERFDETALWIVGEATDAEGRARFPFALPDSVTGWDVFVEAIDGVGGVGVGRARIESFLPLHAELAAPERLTVGDWHEVAAIVANHEAAPGRFAVHLDTTAELEVTAPAEQALEVPAGEVRAARFRVRAQRPGAARLTASLRDANGRERDALVRPLEVSAPGLEQQRVQPGQLRGGREEIELVVPDDADPATVRGRVRLFRGAADQARDGLEGLLREPHGCFEQTTSATYPNLLVLTLLERSGGRHAEAAARARAFVGTGYQRLLRYEVRGGGFSWFGDAPASLVLTALGLVEFSDMAKVYPVDPDVIARTRHWLVRQQRSDGSFTSVGHWGADPGELATTAWLAWALAEAGGADGAVTRALAWLGRSQRALAERPYLTALWAAAEARVRPGGGPAMAQLEALREPAASGATYTPEAEITLFFEGGHEARVETTAVAASARAVALGGPAADDELTWLWGARGGRYGWGTTQATIQALRAAALAEASDRTPETGLVRVTLDGVTVGQLDLAAAEVPTLTLPAGLAPGRHALALVGPPTAGLRTDVRLSWRAGTPPRAQTEGLAVHLTASSTEATLGGAPLALTVAVANPGPKAVAMPTLVIPVPPGFAAVRPSLERLVGRTPVTRFEDLGDRIHLYLGGLEPGAGVVLPYALEAVAPCDVAQAPAQAYAYYQPGVRGSSDALRLRAVRPASTAAAR